MRVPTISARLAPRGAGTPHGAGNRDLRVSDLPLPLGRLEAEEAGAGGGRGDLRPAGGVEGIVGGPGAVEVVGGEDGEGEALAVRERRGENDGPAARVEREGEERRIRDGTLRDVEDVAEDVVDAEGVGGVPRQLPITQREIDHHAYGPRKRLPLK